MNGNRALRYAGTLVISAALSACVLTREREVQQQPGVSGEEQPQEKAATLQDLMNQMGNKVAFEFNSANLTPGAKDALVPIGQYLSQHPNEKVHVDGFTDNVGTSDYNQQLSSSRADAVAMALQEAGAKSNQIVALGEGESKPIASNDTAEGRAENRRAEISIG